MMRRGEFSFGYLTEQSSQSLFGFFDRCRPNPKRTMPWCRCAGKERPSAKSFIEGHNDSALLLRPGEDLFISLPGQSHITSVETAHVGFNSFSHETTAWGTFWSRRMVRRSGTRNDFLFVNHLAGILKRGSDIVGGQFGVCVNDPGHGVATSDHSENVRHHNAGAANVGFPLQILESTTIRSSMMSSSLTNWLSQPKARRFRVSCQDKPLDSNSSTPKPDARARVAQATRAGNRASASSKLDRRTFLGEQLGLTSHYLRRECLVRYDS